MADPVYCGIDVGTQGVRVALVAGDGAVRATATAPITGDHRDGERHEQPPDAWWDALVGAVRAALAQAGPAITVEAVALDTTSGTLVVERPDGTAAGPALMYDDGRAAAQAPRVQAAGAPLWAALGYRIQPTWSLPKLLWLLDNDAVPAGGRIVHQADHLVRRLTGTAVPTDTSTALKSGVDTRSVAWPREVFGQLGIRMDVLPEVVLPGTPIGSIGADAARRTGLPTATPVRAGMTDGCAAQIAAAALDPGSWSSALGTTLIIKGASAELVRDPAGVVYCHRSPDGGWLPGGASSSGAGVLADEFPGADLDDLTRAAARLVPFPGVTYPLVGGGERFPFPAPQAHGFIEPSATTPAARFAALCQAVAYVERLAYDTLACLGADVRGAVSLSGGAARNSWWNQLRTDVLGRPTRLPESVQAAVGMAVLAAAPPGELASTARRMVRIARTYEPDPERGGQLRPGYERLVADLVERGWLDQDLAARALRVGAVAA